MLLELLHVIRYRFGAIYIISSHQNIMSSPVFFSVGFGLLQCVVKEGLALSVHLRQTEGTNSLYQQFRDQYFSGIGVLKRYLVQYEESFMEISVISMSAHDLRQQIAMSYIQSTISQDYKPNPEFLVLQFLLFGYLSLNESTNLRNLQFVVNSYRQRLDKTLKLLGKPS